MVANPRRRAEVTDAALEILGRDGARALTHRAVDARAGVPTGTCANYFPTRAALLLALAQGAFARLAPDPERIATLAQTPDGEALGAYTAYVVERLLAQPDLARALIELRLEASRSAEVAAVVGPFLRQGLRDDVDFHEARGLLGGEDLVLLLHHLVDGILLDHLTVPLVPASDPVAVARRAANALARR